MPRLDKKCFLFTLVILAFLVLFKKYIINKKQIETTFSIEPAYDYNDELLNKGPFLTDTLDGLLWFVQVS